jgi:hypothetical protein
VTVPRLHPADLERLADLVVERLADRLAPGPATGELVDAKHLAAMLGTTPAYVYEHSAKLGAIRLGDGPRARLRFDVERAREAMASGTPATPEPLPHRSRRPTSTTAGGARLLPINRARA